MVPRQVRSSGWLVATRVPPQRTEVRRREQVVLGVALDVLRRQELPERRGQRERPPFLAVPQGDARSVTGIRASNSHGRCSTPFCGSSIWIASRPEISKSSPSTRQSNVHAFVR